jgi:GTP cyclohydrolase I
MASPRTLEDVQGYQDTRGIALHKVGVKGVDLPLNLIQQNGRVQSVQARATMSIGLAEHYKGAHMSRFIIQLAHWSKNHAFCRNLREFLQEAQHRHDAQSAQIKLDFRYFIDKAGPVSGETAPMAYNCSFQAELDGDDQYQFTMAVEVPIATLCPCSKEISDYGAHNQRALIRANLVLDTQHDHMVPWIEDIVAALDECASCPVYPAVKRADEKWMTERAYDNPKFVEDVMRDVVKTLAQFPAVVGYELEVEALESIHGHNAWAYQKHAI